MLVLQIVFIGVGATLITDIWTMARARLFGVASLDYGLVGRWFGHMLEGRFVHERITASPPVRGEKLLGWGVHYAIGVLFAAGLVAAGGLEWMASPKLLPALAYGLLTVAAPFLVMQPGMGRDRRTKDAEALVCPGMEYSDASVVRSGALSCGSRGQAHLLRQEKAG